MYIAVSFFISLQEQFTEVKKILNWQYGVFRCSSLVTLNRGRDPAGLGWLCDISRP